MPKRRKAPRLPHEVIRLTTYSQLDLYLAKFAQGELGLVLLLGRHGTGKSESVKRSLQVLPPGGRPHAAADRSALYVEGHMRPFGLYHSLWEYRDRPIVLDDLDKLYADSDCVRLLKPLCNTEPTKRVSWLTNLTLNKSDIPVSFTTTSRVILVANEWQTLNANVRALEDRAIVLHFDPSNAELHRKVGEWFKDEEVYEFLARVVPYIKSLSMRHYWKGSQLRRAGLVDWRTSLLQMIFPDPRVASVFRIQHEFVLRTEHEKVDRFVAETGYSRATYYRVKRRLMAKNELLKG